MKYMNIKFMYNIVLLRVKSETYDVIKYITLFYIIFIFLKKYN